MRISLPESVCACVLHLRACTHVSPACARANDEGLPRASSSPPRRSRRQVSTRPRHPKTKQLRPSPQTTHLVPSEYQGRPFSGWSSTAEKKTRVPFLEEGRKRSLYRLAAAVESARARVRFGVGKRSVSVNTWVFVVLSTNVTMSPGTRERISRSNACEQHGRIPHAAPATLGRGPCASLLIVLCCAVLCCAVLCCAPVHGQASSALKRVTSRARTSLLFMLVSCAGGSVPAYMLRMNLYTARSAIASRPVHWPGARAVRAYMRACVPTRKRAVAMHGTCLCTSVCIGAVLRAFQSQKGAKKTVRRARTHAHTRMVRGGALWYSAVRGTPGADVGGASRVPVQMWSG